MRIVKGFEKASAVLNRQVSFESIPAPTKLAEGIKEAFGRELTPEQVVAEIVAEVRGRGDAALFDYSYRLSKVQLASLEVSWEEVVEAYNSVDDVLVSALHLSAERIRSFHFACRRNSGVSLAIDGVGQVVSPLGRVGAYVPGGTACYPSTVLMTAIPAKVARVKEIIMVTPPQEDGSIPAATLVAADIAGVNRIFKLGGAQAIAALAYGTESVPRVDKICGPGNIFVAIAKKLAYGVVDVDGIRGPSEVIIIADESANASFCAADLIAQAEHDPMASAILITTSARMANNVENETRLQLANIERNAIAKEAIESRGMIIIVDNLNEAIELANLYAPEHLLLMINDANSSIDRTSCQKLLMDRLAH